MLRPDTSARPCLIGDAEPDPAEVSERGLARSRGAISPGFYEFFAPSLAEGAGKAGRRLRPQHRVQKCAK
jgi:hypothetical protein